MEHVTETGPALAGTGAPRVMVHCCSKFELGLCRGKTEVISQGGIFPQRNKPKLNNSINWQKKRLFEEILNHPAVPDYRNSM